MTEGVQIPAGRCVCCGLKATGVIRVNMIYSGEIKRYELCNLHYRLAVQDINTAVSFFSHTQKYRIEENLQKGDWQYEGGSQ